MASVTPAGFGKSWKEEVVKVRELIAKLGEFDPEMSVLVDNGHGNGFVDPTEIFEMMAVLSDEKSYAGEYDWYFDGIRNKATPFTAVAVR